MPLFLTNVLHVSSAIVGLVEGLGEATPHLFQPISGYLSDRYKKRKPFVLGSQLLRTAMVLLFFATSWVEVLVVRFLDRSAKGINSAPRDALISASVDDKHKGRAFGLSRALDNGGAVVGLGLAGLIT
ncbi:MFS transporter, partial [Candidatus Gottesmanbacteria bacterium]|nr:MFS transporter [Candidatus Gottesmanbacteria bacterium]